MNRQDEMELGESPLVSVIIPTYGRSDELSRALTSVNEQSYENIELVVVDDASPTPVCETIAPDAYANIASSTFVRHGENRGANAARNTGISTASGSLLAFLDDDDSWHPTKLEKQVQTFREVSPRVGVVYTAKKAIGPTGTTIMRANAAGDVLKELLLGRNFGQFSSVMVHRSAVTHVGLPDERFPAWQDREWFFRLAQAFHFWPVSDILTIRHTGTPGSITSKFREKRDIAYPLFVEKHYQTARSVGLYYARTFLASLRRALARSAIHAGEYREARRYFISAFLANPFYRPVYPHLVASLGGEQTYKSAVRLRQSLRRIRKPA